MKQKLTHDVVDFVWVFVMFNIIVLSSFGFLLFSNMQPSFFSKQNSSFACFAENYAGEVRIKVGTQTVQKAIFDPEEPFFGTASPGTNTPPVKNISKLIF